MLEQTQKFYDFIFDDIKKYILSNSKYNPYVFKKEPEDKLFPLVVIKEGTKSGVSTTLKYTDYQYAFVLEINVYALDINGIAGKSICKEISDFIEKYFYDRFRMNIRINPNAINIDSSVSRTLINVNCTLDTKEKDKLIIYPY